MNGSIKKTALEDIIFSFLPHREGYGKRVREAMSQAVKNGGKRIRPLLMGGTYRLFSDGDEERERRLLWPFQASMEMIHSYSLVHDDLPAIDNDELRRGQPTTWKLFGEGMAVIAGDGLLNHAYLILARALLGLEEEDHKRAFIRSMERLAHHSGVDGMIGGQTADILLTGKIPSPDEIDYIYQNKTGALLKASMGIGAILGGAGLEQEAGIEKIAACLGMAYQIRDDILDVESSPELLGKPVLSDDKNNKITYVSLYGMEEAKKEAERLGQEALELLVRISPEKGELYALMEGLLHRKK